MIHFRSSSRCRCRCFLSVELEARYRHEDEEDCNSHLHSFWDDDDWEKAKDSSGSHQHHGTYLAYNHHRYMYPKSLTMTCGHMSAQDRAHLIRSYTISTTLRAYEYVCSRPRQPDPTHDRLFIINPNHMFPLSHDPRILF